jgi:hypothetical protein
MLPASAESGQDLIIKNPVVFIGVTVGVFVGVFVGVGVGVGAQAKTLTEVPVPVDTGMPASVPLARSLSVK